MQRQTHMMENVLKIVSEDRAEAALIVALLTVDILLKVGLLTLLEVLT